MIGRENNYRALLLFMLGLGLIYFLALNSQLDFGGDSANYLILARAIMQAKGYTDIYLPIPAPHTVYPPFFPLMLCSLTLFFGENILVLKLIPLFSMLGATYVLFLLLEDYDKKYNLWIIMFFALNPLILFLAGTLISEAPYFLFSFLSLLLVGKYSSETSLLNKYLWLTLLMMLLSFYTRSIGLVLLPALFCFLLCKRNLKKAALLSALYLMGIFPWILRGILRGSGYIAFLLGNEAGPADSGMVTVSSLLSRFTHNLVIYAGKVLADIFFYPYFYNVAKDHPAFMLKVIVSLILFGLIFYGYIIRVKRGIKPVDFYVFFVFMVCMFWPVHGPRFIASIFAFLIIYFLCGAEAITKARRNLAALAALMIIILSLFADFEHIYKARSNAYEPEEGSYLEALAWIKQHSLPGSRIMCRKPRLTFVIANRRAMYYPQIADPEKIIKVIEENDINYVVLDVWGKKNERFGMWAADKFLRPVIEKYPERFLRVYSSRGPVKNYVYRVIR